jgi:hypothetical protein
MKMKRITLFLLVSLLLVYTSVAYASLGLTSETSLSMLEKAYTDSDKITFTFTYSADDDTYFTLVTMKDISQMTKAYRDGWLEKSGWENIRSSMVDVTVSIDNLIATMIDDDAYHVMLAITDPTDDEATVMLAIYDGEVIIDSVDDATDGL